MAFVSPSIIRPSLSPSLRSTSFRTSASRSDSLCHHDRRAMIRASTSLAQSSHVADLRSVITEVAGTSRGIFGMDDEERSAIENAIIRVENDNPVADCTRDNAAVAHGEWRLLYTTLEILGKRRIKLGVSTPLKQGLVQLGEFVQVIDSQQSKTNNVVHFNVMGQVEGTFSIFASYEVESEQRVRVEMEATELQPESLKKLLGKNEKLLTKIFNPTGFLDITYIDNELRIGRDDKGQIFILERK